MLYTFVHACEKELNPDAIVHVSRTMVEGVEQDAIDAAEVTTSRTEMCMDEQVM